MSNSEELVVSYNHFLIDLAGLYDEHLKATVPTKELRYGQFYFTLLLNYRPDIANSIRGTELDPYYRDKVTTDEHKQIEVLWKAPRSG